MISTFYILAGMFFLMSIFGYFTQRDLTSWGNSVLMAVIGMGLNVWLNVVWSNDPFQLITSGIAVIVFTGIVAFDAKRIKN